MILNLYNFVEFQKIIIIIKLNILLSKNFLNELIDNIKHFLKKVIIENKINKR